MRTNKFQTGQSWFSPVINFHHSLVSKIILVVGVTLFACMSTWAYFNIEYQKKKIMNSVVVGSDRLSNTIKLGTHYAMMLNSRDDINQIINNIGKQREIKNIRIYNKSGEIKFSNSPTEVNDVTNIKNEACYICHQSEPPVSSLELNERIRIYEDGSLLGVISPIYNEPGCSTDSCHFHPPEKKILGALDVVVNLEETTQEIVHFENGIILLSTFVFVVTSGIIFMFVIELVNRPIQELIEKTKQISKGNYSLDFHNIDPRNEIGQLASAIEKMSQEIGKKQNELNRQRDEYQNLFERVPCIITLQDRNFKLLNYNKLFADKFHPKPGEYCYQAYKGRSEKCVVCPVEKTFEDGMAHVSEESGLSKDGILQHWIVSTAPIKNEKGEIVAAMEMNLDITQRMHLKEQLEQSEKKYHAIFNNIPNPVFVLDIDTLEILDCNESVKTVYGFDTEELLKTSFLDLFKDTVEKKNYLNILKTSSELNQVKHLNKFKKTMFVNIRISPSEYPGQKVLLVTISDITKRLETEQQLIQTSKMATLGEMATGVAHELNQPLAVIKTASNFFMKKIRKNEKIKDEILLTMTEEIDSHVNRATKIINHMREFGRKSDMTLDKTQINDVLNKAFEIFSQQLKLRGIRVIWDIEENLPTIMADSGRLEQVFINLLINARDAIDEKWEMNPATQGEKKIILKTKSDEKFVKVEVEDSGKGIPKGMEEKIFEPFFTTKNVGKGTGLGLSISYGIVQDCGGTIQAESTPGEGALFILTFPKVGVA